MASTSTSSSTSATCKTKYDVFLSFRGSDTRQNFTSHLYAALFRKHIHTFIDEKDIERGEQISPTLLSTIEESKISVIIFSENYASSPWCLDELVKIMECTKTTGQKAVPIFYHVDPSDVSDLTGKFGKAFEKAKQQISYSKDRVQKWCCVLEEVAVLSGWDSTNYRNEEELIGKIADYIIQKLHPNPFSTSMDLVGMDSHIEKILPCLSMGSPDACFLGLWGMGGIGKTTIAEVLYSHMSCQFDRSYFFRNVREESGKNGLVHLRKQLISQLLGIENIKVEMLHIVPTFIKDSLNRLKVLVVLDDISDPNQLEALGVGEGWFGPESRIILTTRDYEVLNTVGEMYIYNVEGLCERDALQLLSMKAFKQHYPPEDYEELSTRVLHYAQGLPLAVKVLGSHLCKKGPQEWEIELNKLNKFLDSHIQKILEISFEGLDDLLKDVFLDICCLKGHTEKSVIDILDGCGFPAKWGINRLSDKCLIYVDRCNHEVQIHDLVEEMGQEIARRKGQLYNNKDIIPMSTINMINERIERIVLNMSEVETMHFRFEVLSWMPKLRLIGHPPMNIESDNPPCLSSNLSLLDWANYPFKSLPSTYVMQNLVELHMPDSNVIQLWQENQYLGNLKILNLQRSPNLMRLPDLSSATKMKVINLDGCCNLRSIPEIPSSIVEEFHCVRSLVMEEWPMCIDLNGIATREFPSVIRCSSSSLKSLSIGSCDDLAILPDSIFEFKSLKFLFLFGFLKLSKLPPLNGLRSLEYLYIVDSGIVEIPADIASLASLRRLSVNNCNRLKSLPLLPWQLETFQANHCTMLRAASIASMSFIYFSNPSNFPAIKIQGDYIFSFCNCMNLDNNARCKIMADALWRIKEMTILPNVEASLTVRLPGNEIPEWFNYQSQGDSVVFQLPHFSYPSYLTLAFCVAIEFPASSYGCGINWWCRLKFENFSVKEFSLLLGITRSSKAVEKSDHVLLWYSNLEWARIKEFFSGMEASLQFNFEWSFDPSQRVKCRVKRCGVQWAVLQYK